MIIQFVANLTEFMKRKAIQPVFFQLSDSLKLKDFLTNIELEFDYFCMRCLKRSTNITLKLFHMKRFQSVLEPAS